VLYVSDIDLGFLSYAGHFENRPLPETTALAMKAVPFAFVGMGGLMYGLNWIIKRRIELSEHQDEGED